MKNTKMMRKLSDHRYSQLSSLDEILAEKERLRRKIKKQEKKVSSDWERIEDGWRIVGKITGVLGNLFSSASLLGSAELGYKIFSHFFSKKSKKGKQKSSEVV